MYIDIIALREGATRPPYLVLDFPSSAIDYLSAPFLLTHDFQPELLNPDIIVQMAGRSAYFNYLPLRTSPPSVMLQLSRSTLSSLFPLNAVFVCAQGERVH